MKTQSALRVLAFAAFCVSSAFGAESMKPHAEFRDVAGVAPVATPDGAHAALMCFKAPMRLSRPKESEPVAAAAAYRPAANLPDTATALDALRYSSMLASIGYHNAAVGRPFDLVTLNDDAESSVIRQGFIWAYVDEEQPYPREGPFPSPLFAVSQVMRIERDTGTFAGYIASVPERWPQSLAKTEGAQVPRFVMLQEISSGKENAPQIVFETIADNPFAGEVGVHQEFLGFASAGVPSVLAMCKDGSYAIYDVSKNAWSAIQHASSSDMIGVGATDRGYLMLWRNDEGQLESTITGEPSRAGQGTVEMIRLVSSAELHCTIGGGRIWLMAVERTESHCQVSVATRSVTQHEWTKWKQIATLSADIQLMCSIKAFAEADGPSFCVVALTDRKANDTRIYLVKGSDLE